jgi:hypothetical protein
MPLRLVYTCNGVYGGGGGEVATVDCAVVGDFGI